MFTINSQVLNLAFFHFHFFRGDNTLWRLLCFAWGLFWCKFKISPNVRFFLFNLFFTRTVFLSLLALDFSSFTTLLIWTNSGHLCYRYYFSRLFFTWLKSSWQLRFCFYSIDAIDCNICSRKFNTGHVIHTNIDNVVNKDRYSFFFFLNLNYIRISIGLHYGGYKGFLQLGLV